MNEEQEQKVEEMEELEIKERLELIHSLSGSTEEREEQFRITSIQEANTLLERHMDVGESGFRKWLVDYITDASHRVLGSGSRYHNFIVDLHDAGEYDLVLQMCEYLLASSPHQRDILADAMRACGASGQFERGEGFLKKAFEIHSSLWTFRLFDFSLDFLQEKLEDDPTDDKLCQRIRDLADEFIRNFPYDDRAYNKKAELLLAMNRRAEAIALLKESIFYVHPDENDKHSKLISAQSCVTLIDALDDSNDYDFIIQICEEGLCNTTQALPAARIGYFLYRKALALDAKAHTEGFRVQDTVSEALKFYQAAYDLNQDRDRYRKTIEQRYAVLRPYAQNFQPLVKRSWVVDETESNSEKQ